MRGNSSPVRAREQQKVKSAVLHLRLHTARLECFADQGQSVQMEGMVKGRWWDKHF